MSGFIWVPQFISRQTLNLCSKSCGVEATDAEEAGGWHRAWGAASSGFFPTWEWKGAFLAVISSFVAEYWNNRLLSGVQQRQKAVIAILSSHRRLKDTHLFWEGAHGLGRDAQRSWRFSTLGHLPDFIAHRKQMKCQVGTPVKQAGIYEPVDGGFI